MHRTHHLTLHEVNDGNKVHVERTSGCDSKAMKRIFVYEYLSGGGQTADGQTANEMLAAGLTMRDALVADLLPAADWDVSVAVSDRATRVPEPARSVTPRNGELALDFVARQADSHDLVWVVAPETGGLLARLQRGIDPTRWVGCDGHAIELTSSKRATLLQLHAAGVATPLAFEGAPEITQWVVKPDDGAGAIATRVHAHADAARDDAARRARVDGAAVMEPWVEGEALSLSLLCRAEHAELLSVNRQHLSIDAEGMVSFRHVEINVLTRADPRHAALDALARRVGRSITGLRGFVGIDVVWHAQRGPVVIEVNPRVTCAYVGLSQALGRNLAVEVIAAHNAQALYGQR